MSVETRERFLRAAISSAVHDGPSRSVRSVAAEALATPSLLYRYFGSMEDLDGEARIVALCTVLGDDTGHNYLVELLGGVAGTESHFDADLHAPTFVENELFPKDHIAWLRRNSNFVVWLFSADDFPQVFETVRPGLVRDLFFAGLEVHDQACSLAVKTMAAWVCHAATCSNEELPGVLRWAGETIEQIVTTPDAPDRVNTFTEAIEKFAREVEPALDS